MDELGTPALILAAVTIISPILTSIFTQVTWSSNVKRGVAFGVAAVIAVVYLLTSGQFTNWADIPVAVSAVFGLQQITYQYLLKNIAHKIEVATPIGTEAIVAVAETKYESEYPEDTGTEEYVPVVETPAKHDVG